MAYSNNSNLKAYMAMFGLGALFSWVIFSLSTRPAPATKQLRESSLHPFFLGVTIQFPNEADLKTFETEFKPLAKYVEEKELGTISYILMHSDKDPLQVMILERYKNKDYYLNVHKSSKEFLEFRAKLNTLIERGAVVNGHSYIESNVGFM
jgi:quinol monooxygenase YgiN